ncbi:IS110 family transposase [Vibrio cortegadensis]|uniref:IS110 family transposase n=1 Tax=Vibrio cortegadensis TaxID=1328770 RepID=A0ABV4MBR8_9VIBR
MLRTNVIGIDLAKNVFQVCNISCQGELLSNKAISRQKLKELLAKAKPSLVALEGCATCHYWGRYAESFGHEVRIINPKKVKAYVEGHKTDANDALAIANAALQIGIKYSKPKSMEQQTLMSLEANRQFLSKTIVSLELHIRSIINEYGIVKAKGTKGLAALVTSTLDERDVLPASLMTTLSMLWQQYLNLKDELNHLQKSMNAATRQIEPCKRLMALEGVGEITASMLYANLGDGAQFTNGRQASAFIGLTPKQYSSGGKVTMMGINKFGGVKDLRSMLYLGAMAYIYRLPDSPTNQKQAWLIKLVNRVGFKRACIALANKTVRTAWAMLRYETKYQSKTLFC